MYRPVPLVVQEKLVKLTYNNTDRKNLMRRLREEWKVRPGIVHPERSLSRDSVCRSVRIVARIIITFSGARFDGEYMLEPEWWLNYNNAERSGCNISEVAAVCDRRDIAGQDVCDYQCG